MKTRPILFSAPMVRALLDGTKTQTRRIVKPQPVMRGDDDCLIEYGKKQRYSGPKDYLLDILVRFGCPYGKPGDRLWVRETHCFLDVTKSATSQFPFPDGSFGGDVWDLCIEYSDGTEEDLSVEGNKPKQTRERGEYRWRPSIFMPRWASRITLEITGVRVERLLFISEADALAEGVTVFHKPNGADDGAQYNIGKQWSDFPDIAFQWLWESINGPGSWALNPWVWVVEFKRVEA